MIFPLSTLKENAKALSVFILAGIASFALFVSWEFVFYGKNVFSAVIGVFSLDTPKSTGTIANQAQAGNGFFSLSYVPNNLKFYTQMILGKPTKMLWVFTPLVPIFVAIPGIAGLGASLLDRSRRLFSFSLLVFILANVAFLSSFYSPDARYFIYVIPALLFGLALFLQAIRSTFISKLKAELFIVILFILFGGLLLTSAKRIKNQIALNFRHAETPWYYISVRELNSAVDEFLSKGSDESVIGTKPIVISSLPPYFVDFYSNGEYTLLPLHAQQEFRGSKEIVFGPYDFSDLHALYRSKLAEGKTVFVEKYGLGNEAMLQKAFADLSTDFDLQLLRAGCHDLCNVYQLTEKQSTPSAKVSYGR